MAEIRGERLAQIDVSLEKWPSDTISPAELARAWLYSADVLEPRKTNVPPFGPREITYFLMQYLAFNSPLVTSSFLRIPNPELRQLVEHSMASTGPPSLYKRLLERGGYRVPATVEDQIHSYRGLMMQQHTLVSERMRKREAKLFVNGDQLRQMVRQLAAPFMDDWNIIGALAMDYYVLLRMLSRHDHSTLTPTPNTDGFTRSVSPCARDLTPESGYWMPAYNIYYAGAHHASFVHAVMQSLASPTREIPDLGMDLGTAATATSPIYTERMRVT